MDVRCEKCQTEYELDEARLKPGGVTVKCTNCGHMFKIRKRTTTAGSGLPATTPAPAPAPRATTPRPDSMLNHALDEAPTHSLANTATGDDGPTTADRQWLIRLENGDQKSCRELATLQQWIIAGVVTRESLISRTGKTWKRLGDITELAQYFDIADEARTTREERRSSPTPRPPFKDAAAKGTMLGVGAVPTAAGGTILPDDDEAQTTAAPARRPATQPPPLPGSKIPTKTPPMGSNAATPVPAPRAATPSSSTASGNPGPARRPLTTPPPPPPKKTPTQPPPIAEAGEAHVGGPNLKGGNLPAPSGNRATAAWATDGADKVGAGGAGGSVGPSGPFVGKLAAIPDEPAFAGAGRVRVAPSDERSFDTGRVRVEDDEDDLLPERRGSSGGVWIALAVLVLGGGIAAGVWFFVLRDKGPAQQATAPVIDGGAVATEGPEAGIVAPTPDAFEAPVQSALDLARAELAPDHEAKLRAEYDKLAGKDEPAAHAIRAHLGLALAQAWIDRAGVSGEKADADKLRKDAKALVLEAATAAQKAHKALPDDPAANLAMAHVLRLQGKPARDVQRYLDAAKAKPGDWARDVALASALLLHRDGKLADAKAAFAAIDAGDGRLETSGDVRARFHLALIALAEDRAADAKPLVDQVLAAQPEHAGARALAAKLETVVAKTDPLPPEDPKDPVNTGSGARPDPTPAVGGGDYDSLTRRGDDLAEKGNCTAASEAYGKALEKKPNGVEALVGLGYCHLTKKDFASAQSRFRTALVISSKYEPALAGVAEAYQQQGRKEDAIAAWRRYLEAYPNAKKATNALDRLGAGATDTPPQGSGSAPGSGSAEPPPPPPPPAPTPAPADGSGSASN